MMGFVFFSIMALASKILSVSTATEQPRSHAGFKHSEFYTISLDVVHV